MAGDLLARWADKCEGEAKRRILTAPRTFAVFFHFKHVLKDMFCSLHLPDKGTHARRHARRHARKLCVPLHFCWLTPLPLVKSDLCSFQRATTTGTLLFSCPTVFSSQRCVASGPSESSSAAASCYFVPSKESVNG